mmetsp:Transcript_1775/g.4034  ORF Transcript_1775/g.4034 Transcript_1775/m.4034 type:complete len:257 (-) Transcript_1775:330-1100(-)
MSGHASLATAAASRAMRAALARGDVCAAQAAFLDWAEKAPRSSPPRELADLLAETARASGDAELAARAGGRPRKKPEPASSSASASASLALMRAIKRGGGREAFARLAGSHSTASRLRATPAGTRQCLNALLLECEGSESEDSVGFLLTTMRKWGLCPDAYTVNALLSRGLSSAALCVRQLWVTGSPPPSGPPAWPTESQPTLRTCWRTPTPRRRSTSWWRTRRWRCWRVGRTRRRRASASSGACPKRTPPPSTRP